MKKMVNHLLLLNLMLLASCGIGGSPIGTSYAEEKESTRKQVLIFDQDVIKREISEMPRNTPPCTDSPSIEIKTLSSKPEMISERWIVTHPVCNTTHVYYVCHKRIRPGAYYTTVGSGFPTDH